MNECFWLKPDGEPIYCNPGEHDKIAKEHFSHVENYLLEAEKSWVKLTILDGRYIISFFCRPTLAQKEFLWNWCEQNHQEDLYVHQ